MDLHYMVELDYYIPELEEDGKLEEIENLIIAFLNTTGRLISLSLSHEEAVFWLVMRVDSEDEIVEIMNSIPVDYELSFDYFQLDHYEVIQEIGSFSLN
ncbi:MAG: hypothetical protein ACM3PT_00630 [Deltaproteobacteria bacterium]